MKMPSMVQRRVVRDICNFFVDRKRTRVRHDLEQRSRIRRGEGIPSIQLVPSSTEEGVAPFYRNPLPETTPILHDSDVWSGKRSEVDWPMFTEEGGIAGV